MAKYFPEDLFASPECDFSTKAEFPGFSFTRQLKSFKSLKKVFKAERYTSNLSNVPQSKLLLLGKAFSEIPCPCYAVRILGVTIFQHPVHMCSTPISALSTESFS